MDIPGPERRRVKITTDTRASSISTLATNLANAHPFTQQIDLIFPTPDVKETDFVGLNTRYYRARVSLSNVTDEAGPFGDLFLKSDRFTMLSVDDSSDDVWCIDQRGVLTLTVSKLTYERLGLVGQKLPFKDREEQYVISADLRNKNAETTGNRSRRIESLRSWDKQREQDGRGLWNVLFSFKSEDFTSDRILATSELREVVAKVAKTNDVRIPSGVSLQPSHGQALSEEDAEDWNANLATLLEWAGLAALGSQRLKAYDRVDPFVSLYECPSPSFVGNLTSTRWTGFLSPSFVQTLLSTAVNAIIGISSSNPERIPVVAIMFHGITASPVAYIPASTPDGRSRPPPAHLPSSDEEDTWCLVLTPGSEPGSLSCVLAESVGQHDKRWG